MRMPSNGRGLHPIVDGSTFAHWHLDDFAAGTAADTVRNQRPLAAVGAIPTPALGTGRVGLERLFTGGQVLGRAATAADMTFAQGTWTVSVWARILNVGVVGDWRTLLALGGRDGVDGGTADDNVQLAIGFYRDASAVPYPGTNGEVRPSLFFEDGAGVDHLLIATAVDLRRFDTGWFLVTWRKSVGAPFTYDCLINGRLVQSFAGQPSSTSGALTNQRWTMGATIDAAGTGVARASTSRICSAHAQSGPLSNSEVEGAWRRGAGLALPSALHGRLFVKDQGGVFRDLTDPTVVGDDFVERVELADGIDDQAEQMTASLFREGGDLSVAPLRGDSKLNNPTLAPSFTPFIDLWREVRFEQARVPLWLSPAGADWINRFQGRIDELDDGGERVIITCRDQGGRLAERYISQERSYPAAGDLGSNGCGGAAGGRETVMQRVIDDNGGAGAFGAFATLYVPIPTQSCMVPMQQPLPRGHLLPTLRTLSGHIGWDCRSRWSNALDLHALTMFDPGRGRVDCDAVIAERDVVRTPTGRQDASGVRNVITVTYPDRLSVGVASDQGLANPASATVTNPGSVAQFDERRMEAIEDQSSQIDTAVEATRMAQAISDDLAYPWRESAHELVGIPELTAHDVCLMQPDFLRTTVNQEGAVRSVRHVFERGGCTTTVNAQGKPAAGYNRWLSIEAGRNGRPPIRNPGEALTGRGIGSLLPGILDVVERSIYLGGTKFVELKNGDFARFTRGSVNPPDSWSPFQIGAALPVWSAAGDVYYESGVQLSGGYAVRLQTADGALASQPIPITGDPNTPFSFELTWLRVVAAAGLPRVDVRWLTAAGALISTSTIEPTGGSVPNFRSVPTTAGIWFTSRCDGILPPAVGTARFAQVVVRPSTALAFDDVILDTVSAYRCARELLTWFTTSYVTPVAGGTTNWFAVQSGFTTMPSPLTMRYDLGNQAFYSGGAPTGATTIPTTGEVLGAAMGAGYYAREDQTVLVNAVLAVGSSSGSDSMRCGIRLMKNGTYGANHQNTGGTPVGQGAFAELEIGTSFNHPDIVASRAAILNMSQRVSLARGDRLSMEFTRTDTTIQALGGGVAQPGTLTRLHVKQELTQ